jgi:DNA-directed RNA polymerase subunit M/transcription elongation factor TFIIS
MSNPLQQYFRTPKVFVKLPTQGHYNNSADIEFSANNEVGVCALTVIDQLLLKTPDALLNGETLLQVIKSCVPAVKNVRALTQPDINALVIGIRVASNGPKFEFEVLCPSCSHENEVSLDLNHYLDSMGTVEENKTVDLNGDLTVHVKPYTFEQRNLQLLNEFDEVRALKVIDGNTEQTETEKMTTLSHHVNTMAGRTFDIVANSITKIVIKEGNQTVTDQAHIAEFIKGISKEQAQAIMAAIKELNNSGVGKTANLKCEKCDHSWEQEIDFDPTSFFD